MRYEVESTVRAIYGRAGLGHDDIRYMPWLLRAAYGQKCLRRLRLANGAMGEMRVLDGAPVFIAHAGLTEPLRWWIWGHEAAHFERRTTCVRNNGCRATEERICDAVGAALGMPLVAFQRRVNEVGVDLAQLALDFRTTQTSVARRLGEIEERCVAVRLAHRAEPYVSGPEWWNATTEEVRQLERSQRPDVSKFRLTDVRGVAIMLQHDRYHAA